jgi:uncharacterized protein (DUF849 family)
MESRELIINFTPTGMIPTKAMTPYVPVSVNEIVEEIHEAIEIGITMAHIHARDEGNGLPTYKSDIYARIIEGIRKFSGDLIICVSLSGRTFSEFAQRAEPLMLDGSLKPDMGSLTLSSLNFNNTASINTPEMIMALAAKMNERKILPELEVFDVGMINYAKFLVKKNLLKQPHYFNILIGNIACAQANLLHTGLLINDLPDNSFWSFAGIGNAQFQVNSLAVAAGGGVRVGLEDNIWFDQQRTTLAKNSDLLKRIKRLAVANEREIMHPSALRKLLCLETGFGRYGLV